MSCVFAPERTTDSGSPFSSVKMLRFAPIFSTVGWIMPNRLLSQRRFYHTTINALPFPANSFQFIVFLQTQYPYLFKEACRLSFLKIPVDTAAGTIFSRHCFPLASSSQNIEDTFQHLPDGQAWPPLPRRLLVMFVRIPLFFRNILFDFFPEFV